MSTEAKTHEITIYSKFGIKCYDINAKHWTDENLAAFYRGYIDHRQYRERVTILNKKTNKVTFLQNF